MGEKTIRRTVSADGTEIGYGSSGEGPPVLLVHGALSDHMRFEALRPHLEPHATVYAMDRRGRGFSGDGPDYDIEREYEDVAAVVDAIALAADRPVRVYGHSSGGIYAYGAASLTAKHRRVGALRRLAADDNGTVERAPGGHRADGGAAGQG